MCCNYNDVHAEGSVNSQEYKRFEMYAVTIKISTSDYHHLINRLAHGLF